MRCREAQPRCREGNYSQNLFQGEQSSILPPCGPDRPSLETLLAQLCGQYSPPRCVCDLSTAVLTLKCAVRRYQLFKGLLGAFDEERRRFRGKLREQELLMQVRYSQKAQRGKKNFALELLCLFRIGLRSVLLSDDLPIFACIKPR